MINVPLPRLLDQSLHEVRRIEPISASVNLNIEPLSTATLVVDIDDDIPLRSRIEMFTSSGSAGIFRVREIRSEYGTRNIKTLSLEHTLCELADVALYNISADAEMTVHDFLERWILVINVHRELFGLRTFWGIAETDCTDTVFIPGGDYDVYNKLSSLLDVMEQIPDYMIETDQTTIPWKIRIVKRPTEVSAEGRLSRNVRASTVQTDDRELYSAVVVLCDNQEHKYTDEDAFAEYGELTNIVNMENGTPQEIIDKYAERYLKKHTKPKVSVQIEALDLSQITGETLDALKIGKKYRLVIDGFVKEENITQMSWNDVYGDPTSVTITLAEPQEKVSKILHKQNTSKVTKKKRK